MGVFAMISKTTRLKYIYFKHLTRLFLVVLSIQISCPKIYSKVVIFNFFYSSCIFKNVSISYCITWWFFKSLLSWCVSFNLILSKPLFLFVNKCMLLKCKWRENIFLCDSFSFFFFLIFLFLSPHEDVNEDLFYSFVCELLCSSQKR